MQISSVLVPLFVVAVLTGFLVEGPPAQSAESRRAFALLSDIHFDPFDPPELAERLADSPVEAWPMIFATIQEQVMSSWGRDTNYALFASSLDALARSAETADFIIVPGDFLTHDFEKKAANALGAASTEEKVSALAVGTTVFVGESLAGVLPDKPIIIALGNNDSDCGDYEITPGGRYLAETKDVVRRLAGADLMATDFDRTYAAGGYYAVRHPGLSETLIVVVNDILWSADYRDACGSDGDDAAEAMLAWLRHQLASQKAAGSSVWLVHHIPWGIDPFSTAHSHDSACAAKVVPFLRDPYADAFIGLLRDYRDVIQASYAGHIHTDDYRLLIDDNGNALGLQKVVPAISPIYNQNPAFQIVAYETTTGIPTDFSTYYLANLDQASLAVPGDWRLEYTFSDAYGVGSYSADGVAAMVKTITGGLAAETYRRFTLVSHGSLSVKDLGAYVCAMTRLKRSGFVNCYCSG